MTWSAAAHSSSRSADEYDDAHLPGALNIPLKELDATSVSRLRRDRPVITYCNDFQ